MPTKTAATVSEVIESNAVRERYPGLTARWLDKARCRGDGPRFIKAGKKVLYRVAEIERWFDEQTRRSTSDTGPPRIERPRPVTAEVREAAE